MTVKLAVLGAGRIGRIHIDNALNHLTNVELSAVGDPYLDEEWARSLPVPHKFINESDFWQSDFDAVLLCTPSDKHAQGVLRALQLGRHIFCEKPLAKHLEQNIRVQKALAECESIFQIGFNRRFDPDFRVMKDRVRSGALGKIHYLRITSRDPQLPSKEYLKSSGGLFFDMAIHDFDMARYLIGSEVVEVLARGAALVDREITSFGDIDTAVCQLRFADGTLGVIDNSRQAVYGYDQRVEVFGSEGSLSNENHTPTSITKADRDACRRDNPLDFFIERYRESFRQEVQSFIDSIESGSSASPTVADAVAAVKIAEAAYKSFESGHPVSC